jgi:citrate lyase beta subunit
VFEHYGRPSLLREEVERDLEFGLLSKTAIHPLQVAVIQSCYAVPAEEEAEARAILDEARPAVFASGGSMAEPATHQAWAETILRRARYFGVRGEAGAAVASG